MVLLFQSNKKMHAARKKLFNSKVYHIKNDVDSTSLFKQLKSKLYVFKMFLLRGLIIDLYCLPVPNQRGVQLDRFANRRTVRYR